VATDRLKTTDFFGEYGIGGAIFNWDQILHTHTPPGAADSQKDRSRRSATEISRFFAISEFVDIFWIRGHQCSTALRESKFSIFVFSVPFSSTRCIYQAAGDSAGGWVETIFMRQLADIEQDSKTNQSRDLTAQPVFDSEKG
jgi:hypothetical protein